jgi:Zn-dependent protease with chaperone function
MISDALYPPSPKDPPVGFETTTAYRVRVVLVLLSLLLFLAIYLGLVVASGWLVLWALGGPTSRKNDFGFMDFLLVVGAAMLFLFFLKGLFKRSRRDVDKLVEVREKEQPELFAFVRQLCKDAGAPLPKGIYLTHEVNAAVFYPRSLLSLIFPARKNLLIGVGLVNLLNLSELKAVLAHEFGHFTQSSMKLGQYVYVANQAIYDMAFARDSWDEWLAKWRSIDLRISFPAWIITGIVFVLRHFLKLIFRVVNIANLSLSRQMEFNADLNAVRLTGSDALISGLWKTERGGLAMQRALALLHSMAEHGKFSDDLFFHQTSELERLDDLLDKQGQKSAYVKSLREPYSYGQAVHFQVGDDHAPSMWSTHPANREREINAKKVYVKQEPVETPSWKLLVGRNPLKKRLTLLAYDEVLGFQVQASRCLPAAEVQDLAKEDEQEREQAAHYHGLYENRIIELGDIDKLILSLDAEGAPDEAKLREKAIAWTGARLASFMGKHKRVNEDIATLSAAVPTERGKSKKTFELRGKTRSIDEAAKLLEEAAAKAEEIRKRMKTADRALFRFFYSRAKGSPEVREELVRRYRFLLSVQELIVLLRTQERVVGNVIEMLQKNNEMSQEQFHSVVAALQGCYGALERAEVMSRKIRLPKLTHLDEGATAASFVMPEGILEPMNPARIEGPWLVKMMRQLDQALGRLRKLHFKNLGVLLKLQEDLAPELYAPTDASAKAEAETETDTGADVGAEAGAEAEAEAATEQGGQPA